MFAGQGRAAKFSVYNSRAYAYLIYFVSRNAENDSFRGAEAKKVAESLASTNISCTFAPLFDSVGGK